MVFPIKKDGESGREYVPVLKIVLPPSPVVGGVAVPLRGDMTAQGEGLPIAYVCKGRDPGKAGLERQAKLAPLLDAFFSGDEDEEEGGAAAEQSKRDPGRAAARERARLEASSAMARIGFEAYGEEVIDNEILPRLGVESMAYLLQALQGISPDVRVSK